MSAINSEIKLLEPLLQGVEHSITGYRRKTEITGLCSDSRNAQPGNLFAAIKGLTVDGHDFLDQAVAVGCSVLLVNRGWREKVASFGNQHRITIVEVDDTKTALGLIAANYYGHPDRQLNMIGITGTNGKTTTSFLVEALLNSCGRRPGVIGTVNYRFKDHKDRYIEMEAPFTTPESPVLFGLLRRMADEGITDVVMEVSSHALAQSRLEGLAFNIGVFTNLTRDHLDFHADMHNYFTSKRLLFTNHLKPGSRVVIMLADTSSKTGEIPSGSDNSDNWSRILHQELLEIFQARGNYPVITTCGLGRDCDIHPQNYNSGINGIACKITTPAGTLSLKSPLVGDFNLRNILCALTIGLARGETTGCMKTGLEQVKTIPGRLERVGMESAAARCPAVFVDYAHTPDALENVAATLRELKHGRLICVFGCGGDRDPGKRPLMGEISGRLCEVVLATSDNPRSESPEKILAQVEAGLIRSGLPRASAAEILANGNGRGYDVIMNRHQAIRTAIRLSQPEDIILISGKGHENYQQGCNGKVFFDDRIEAEMHLAAKSGARPAWKLKWVRQITGGQLLSPVDSIPVTFSNISTDSRRIAEGELFIALKGENFDGRTFAEAAVEKGAAGLLINYKPDRREPPLDFIPPVPVLLVPDTLVALGQLAGSLRRWHNNLRVLAITGSSGKTTVKEMAAAILSRNHATLKTEGNFNNLIGLPLTIFRLQPEHEMAVLEMGMNRPGEIAALTEIADPDVACIVNIQEAHLEGLGDIQGVANAKNELFAGLKPEGKVAVNLDDSMVSSLAGVLLQEKITFGFHREAFIRATDIQNMGLEGMEFTLHMGDETSRVIIRAHGRHNILNSLAAAALTAGVGAGIEEIAEGLAAFRPYDKRARVEELPSGVMVLNDCYNANPSSMLAALDTLLDLKGDRRAAAVLGDMLELGKKTVAAHAALGKKVKESGLDFLAAFGDQAENVVKGAKKVGMDPKAAQAFSSKKDLAVWLGDLVRTGKIRPGDWFLVKGSRGMRMEEVIALLRQTKSTMKAAGS